MQRGLQILFLLLNLAFSLAKKIKSSVRYLAENSTKSLCQL